MTPNQHCWLPVEWMTLFSSTMYTMQKWTDEASSTLQKVKVQP